MSKRKALGRGLSALLPESPDDAKTAKDGNGLRMVPIDDLHPGLQPRHEFHQQALVSLAESIRQNGILQPIVVREAEGKLLILAGERRWRAARLAGLKQVSVLVREATDRQAFELALVENIQREDLNPIEEAEAYHRLVKEHGHTQEQVATLVGRDRSTVTNALRLLRLPGDVRVLVAEGSLSAGHARTLLTLDGPKAMSVMAHRVVTDALSVRQTEALVRLATQPRPPKKPVVQKSSALRDLEERLKRSLQTKVRIQSKSKKRGKVEIEYHSLEELDRLLEILLR
ncbi:MAG: ParB/RepB/Spo0J family partition protein [Deltaproteobacteria bacterium]|nr:ParB/RepB/Spo0J family partition protein [Deltaproteobacteria bacterium]